MAALASLVDRGHGLLCGELSGGGYSEELVEVELALWRLAAEALGIAPLPDAKTVGFATVRHILEEAVAKATAEKKTRYQKKFTSPKGSRFDEILVEHDFPEGADPDSFWVGEVFLFWQSGEAGYMGSPAPLQLVVEAAKGLGLTQESKWERKEEEKKEEPVAAAHDICTICGADNGEADPVSGHGAQRLGFNCHACGGN